MAEQPSVPTPEATTPPSSAVPAPSAKELWKRRLVIGIVIAVIVLALSLLGAATFWAIQPQNQEFTRGLRDVAIIFLAFLSIIIGAMLVLLIYQVTMLTLLMRDEIKPLLESINATTNTLRGTAAFMSDNVVQPTIKVASAFAGVQRAFESLTGIRSSVNPKQRKEQ